VHDRASNPRPLILNRCVTTLRWVLTGTLSVLDYKGSLKLQQPIWATALPDGVINEIYRSILIYRSLLILSSSIKIIAHSGIRRSVVTAADQKRLTSLSACTFCVDMTTRWEINVYCRHEVTASKLLLLNTGCIKPLDFYRSTLNARRYSRDKGVRLSVCLSVKRVNCDKTKERSVQIFIPYERSFNLVFWEKERLGGGATTSTWNFWSTGPRWS